MPQLRNLLAWPKQREHRGKRFRGREGIEAVMNKNTMGEQIRNRQPPDHCENEIGILSRFFRIIGETLRLNDQPPIKRGGDSHKNKTIKKPENSVAVAGLNSISLLFNPIITGKPPITSITAKSVNVMVNISARTSVPMY